MALRVGRLAPSKFLVRQAPQPHLSEAYADMGFRRGDFPITEEMADTFLSIPIGPHMAEEDARQVVETIRQTCYQT